MTFKERFLEKYFLEEERDKKEKKFMELTQWNITVYEYTTRFECLSCFGSHMVDNARKKIKKYHKGLKSYL